MIRFWAKTGDGDDYLPVERHLLDAGEVATRLFDTALTPEQRDWIASGFAVDVARARSIVGFLVAGHDIGKIGPFQRLAPVLADELGSAALPGFPGSRRRHDRVSGYVLHQFVTEYGGSRHLAKALVATVCGHHSVPQSIPGSELRGAALAWQTSWWPHQKSLLARIAETFGVTSFDGVSTPGHGVTLTIAGLVNLSDWNASDAKRFPVTSGHRRPSSWLAEKAIVAEAWQPSPVASGSSFADTFGFQPRASQATLVDRLDDARLPALVLVEDRTGSGKTEAALWVVRRALERGARGMYVGLPTRATADQFHGRAAAFLEALWPESHHHLRLLHGGSHLRDAGDPEPSKLGEDPVDEELVIARMWFDGPRRGLLSPYAVGTIDQALLAVLRARFYPVRLWGLAGKVVVVDEAHAYDTYTGGLLDSLLRWLGAMECTVVVLSATLPCRRRQQLTTAYRCGLAGGTSSVPAGIASGQTVGYPRITIVDRRGQETLAVVDDRSGRTVQLDHLLCKEDDPALIEAAMTEVQGGGCVAVVASTVKLAQDRFTALRQALPDVPIMLLHGRIRPLERQPIERALAAQLGPRATGEDRPDRLVVVATQIIEQSLDLDFDAMITDLAPIDLLVQRAGRVHRHARDTRPERHAQPRLVVIDTPGDQIHRDLGSGTGAVYVDAVLMRTRAALRGRTEIAEPADLDDLIAAVYDDDHPPGLLPEEHEALSERDRRATVAAAEHGAWAEENGIGIPDSEDPPWSGRASELEDGDVPTATPKLAAVTRWSERPSVDVVVLRGDETDLATGGLALTRARELLLRAVPISDPRITGPILQDPNAHRPIAWQRHGALCHHQLAVLGQTTLELDWDPDLGVVW